MCVSEGVCVSVCVKSKREREREMGAEREREKKRERERRYDWRFDGQLSYFCPCALFQRVAEMKKKFEDDRQREVSLVVSKRQLVGESGTK